LTIFVLDSSAVLRYIDNEAGANRVNAMFKACVNRQAEARISAVQWGEIAGRLRKRLGAPTQERVLDSLIPLEIEIVPATAERAVQAAVLRMDRGIPYADAFALNLAMESPNHMLVTADYDFQPVADLAQIEFLPKK
jgi:PIN domain nuclease of toxin-antitoxin system